MAIHHFPTRPRPFTRDRDRRLADALATLADFAPHVDDHLDELRRQGGDGLVDDWHRVTNDLFLVAEKHAE